LLIFVTASFTYILSQILKTRGFNYIKDIIKS
jgi:uncharacterized PurR-regulated membrane protein YhhQ (DUF165 family)